MMNRACCWLLRFQGQILLTPDETGSLAFPSSLPDGVKIDENALTIGHWQGRDCLAADVEHLPENLPGEWVALRQVFATVGFEHFMQAGRASQLLDWWKNNRFCGRGARRGALREYSPRKSLEPCCASLRCSPLLVLVS